MTTTNDTAPWDGYDHGWSGVEMDQYADDLDVDVDSLITTLRKSAWLENEATIEEVVEHELGDSVLDIDYATPNPAGLYLITRFETMPGDVTIEHGIDGMIDWMGVRRAIDEYTDYHITNTRLSDMTGGHGERLIVTLAPEDDT